MLSIKGDDVYNKNEELIGYFGKGKDKWVYIPENYIYRYDEVDLWKIIKELKNRKN